MAYVIRQSTAITVALGPFLDETDGKTIENALTITQPDIRLSKNGDAFAQKSAAQTLSHMENGYYSLSLSTTDTNTVGILHLHCHEAGALPVWLEFQVVEEVIYDALYAASATGLLPANMTQIAGASVSTSTAQIGVNAVQAGGTAWASGAITANSIASNAITDAKIASGALTAAKFAAGAFDAVWSVATRLLTAGTNIVLAKDTGVTGFNDLSAAAVNAEVDTALADYDAPTKAELDAGLAALNDIEVADILAAAYEGAETVQDFLRLARAALYGKLAGAATTTITMRDAGDTKNRISATVDEDGNRTALTLDPS